MTDEVELHGWEAVTEKDGRIPTERMRVPGGWIYAVRQGRIILTMVFVPDGS